jgi:hypothetical protein
MQSKRFHSLARQNRTKFQDILNDNLINFIHFHNFTLLLLQYSKFLGNVSDSFKFWEFQTENAKARLKTNLRQKSEYRSYLVPTNKIV